MGQTVELADVVASAMETALQGVWTAMPGRIEAYDAATQTASIRLTVKPAFIGEDGERDTHDVPPLPSVPLLMHGGGGFRQTFPVKSGDFVLVVFLSRAASAWLHGGGVGVDEVDDRHHHMTDAVAITGLRPMPSVLQNAPTDRMSIGSDNGPSIEVDGSEVRLGGNDATAKVALNTDLSQLVTILAGVTPGIGSGDAAIAALQSYLGSHILFPAGASKVKAK